MTPEQVTKRQAWAYALIGAGIACLFMAYQYAIPPTGRAEPPPEFAPYLFGGLGLACFIAGGILWSKLKKEPTPPAKTDLKSPQGKAVIRLMAIGGIALVALTIVNIMAPEGDPMWLAGSVVLLIIMSVCFVSAGRVARKIRNAASTTGAVK
jgi:peptidoglycan/LPS O-acetylase OafA/YrhL